MRWIMRMGACSVLIVSSVMAQYGYYDPGWPPCQWVYQGIACECNEIQKGLIPNPETQDFSQNYNIQGIIWGLFESVYPVVDDSDYVGPATYSYNCHSYILNGQDGWVPDPSNFLGNSIGCWRQDPAGYVLHNYYHTCYGSYNQYLGKCGAMFLIINSMLLYNGMPDANLYELVN